MTQSKVVSERSTHSEFQDIPQDQQKYTKLLDPREFLQLLLFANQQKRSNSKSLLKRIALKKQ